MGEIVEKTSNVRTVGELITALQRYPADMAIDVGMANVVSVHRIQPVPGDVIDDPRGYVCIENDDS